MIHINTLFIVLITSAPIFASPTIELPAVANEPRTTYYQRLVVRCNGNCSARGLKCAQSCIDELGKTGEGKYCLLKCSAASVACGNQVS